MASSTRDSSNTNSVSSSSSSSASSSKSHHRRPPASSKRKNCGSDDQIGKRAKHSDSDVIITSTPLPVQPTATAPTTNSNSQTAAATTTTATETISVDTSTGNKSQLNVRDLILQEPLRLTQPKTPATIQLPPETTPNQKLVMETTTTAVLVKTTTSETTEHQSNQCDNDDTCDDGSTQLRTKIVASSIQPIPTNTVVTTKLEIPDDTIASNNISPTAPISLTVTLPPQQQQQQTVSSLPVTTPPILNTANKEVTAAKSLGDEPIEFPGLESIVYNEESGHGNEVAEFSAVLVRNLKGIKEATGVKLNFSQSNVGTDYLKSNGAFARTALQKLDVKNESGDIYPTVLKEIAESRDNTQRRILALYNGDHSSVVVWMESKGYRRSSPVDYETIDFLIECYDLV
jgi:hypothetical protein